ncbi:g6428 [Coccomyxa viridis]|uniref:30S ribosomal protein S15 n=1 Tax=Coccomyxa viridis TaxID=1274662 RepID=A0ABP1FZB3_9CHLO
MAAQSVCSMAPVLASTKTLPTTPASRSGFLQGSTLSAAPQHILAASRRAPLCIQARYRGTGTDLSKVPPFKRHEQDCGSTEVQVARISARVTQLTSHLKEHKKDYAATRGLVKMLGQRRRLMTYLYKESRPKYEQILRELGVRPLKVQASRGVIVKLTEGSEVEVMGAEEQEAATT